MRSLLHILLALSLMLHVPAFVQVRAAQDLNLPHLGDPASKALSPETEARLGRTMYFRLQRSGQIDADPEVTQYLERLGKHLTQNSNLSNAITYFLVKDRTLNAFAMPGGYIGIHSGLVVAAEDESELAAVMAHEIAHLSQRHIARMLGNEKAKKGQLVTLASLLLAALTVQNNPNAAVGVAQAGAAYGLDQSLSFSREAEREADNIGLSILQRGGFDPQGMERFFGRMQKASRVYQNEYSAYVRTHPFLHERRADMQNRIAPSPSMLSTPMPLKKTYLNNLGFRLVKAKLTAQQYMGVDAQKKAKIYWAQELKHRQGEDKAVAAYTLAWLHQHSGQGQEALKAYVVAQRVVQHPMLAYLEANIYRGLKQTTKALNVLKQARKRYPYQHALTYALVRSYLSLGRMQKANRLLSTELARYPQDITLWKLKTEASERAHQKGLYHRSNAEVLMLQGAFREALAQFKRARGHKDVDFYTGSIIDARIRALEGKIKQEALRQKP